MNEKVRYAIEQLLRNKVDSFAEKVAPLYEQLDWKWLRTSTNFGVPTVDDITTELYRQIDRLVHISEGKDEYSVESGGLGVSYELMDGGDEPDFYEVEMKFTVGERMYVDKV